MHQLTDLGTGTGIGNLLRQVYMHLVKRGLCAMQYGHQVDDGILPVRCTLQCHRVVHIQFQHRSRRQMHQVVRIAGAAGGDSDIPASAHQLFTNMAADKAGTAQN